MPDSLSVLKALAKGGAAPAPKASSSSFAKQLAAIGNTPKVTLDLGGGAAKTEQAKHGQDFWSWVGDIIDRPRRAVGQTLEAVGDAGLDLIDSKRAKKDVLSNIGNVLSAPVRGLTSTNKSDQESTSDLIENFAVRGAKTQANHDIVKALTRMSYTNTAVDQAAKSDGFKIAKGIGGFVGDVATDPLTYVPLPVGKGIGAVSKLLGKGSAKIGAEVVDNSAKVAADQPVAKRLLELETGNPEVRVGPDGISTRYVGGRPVSQPVRDEVGASAANIANRAVDDILSVPGRIPTSKVADTDPMLKPALEQTVERMTKADLDRTEKAALAAVPKFISNHFDAKNYDTVLRSGAVATAEGGEGFAKFTNQLGTHASWNLLQDIQRPLQREAAEAGLKGESRADWMAEQVFGTQRLSEGLLNSRDAVFHLDWQNERIPVSAGQLFDLMRSASPEADRALKLALFNQNTAVAPTKIMEAAVLAAKGEPAEVVLAHLQSAPKGRIRTGDVGSHFLAGGVRKVRVATSGGKYRMVSNDEIARGLVDGLVGPNQQTKLVALMNRNVAEYQQRFTSEYLQMSDEIKSGITALVNDPARLGDALVAINRPQVAAKAIAERAHTLAESAAAAVDDVVEDMPAGAARIAHGAVKTDTAARAADPVAANRAVADVVEGGGKQADAASTDELMAGFPEDTINVAQRLSTEAYRRAQGGFWAFADPLARGVNEGRGLEGTGLFHVYNSFGSAKRAAADFHGSLINQAARLAKPIEGTERTTLQEATENYFRGVISENPEIAAQQRLVEQVMSTVLPAGGGSSVLGSVFHRVGLVGGDGLAWLNARFASAHYPGLNGHMFDESAAVALAKAEKISVFEAALRQTADWDIADPAQFMRSLSVMSLRAANEASIVHAAQNQLVRLGLAATNPTKGMSRAVFDKASPMQAFTDPNLRVDPQAAAALQALHGMLTPTAPAAGAWGKFLREGFDPLQQVWKFGVTLIRPGHHIRNLIGNMSMNFMAEGGRFAGKATRDAVKIMATRNDYTGVDAIKMLEAFGDVEYKGAKEVLYSTRFGKVTSDDMYARLTNNGVFAKFEDIEGIGDLARRGSADAPEEGTKALSTISRLVTRGNPVSKAAGRVSEWNDHASKAAQAAQILRKYERDGFITAAWGQKIRPQSMDELFQVVGDRVRRYHPDGQTLTEFERRVARRVIPFYTWMRGALPALLETSAMNPGRATVFTKTSYNLAVASGVSPDSLADPFPTDQLFPSWLENQTTGPQLKIGGDYFSVKPGIATLDMGNTFPDPTPLGVGKAGISMLTPLIRTPLEAVSGTSLTTGAPIKDWSDYVDQQLPGVSNIAGITGYSVAGSAAGLASGAGLDQTASVRKGNREQVGGSQILSWLTGVSAQNVSAPNIIKSAEFEQKSMAQKLAEGQATRF